MKESPKDRESGILLGFYIAPGLISVKEQESSCCTVDRRFAEVRVLGFPFGGVFVFFLFLFTFCFLPKKSKNRKRFCCGSLLGLLACGNLLCGVLEVCVVEFFARREFGWWG